MFYWQIAMHNNVLACIFLSFYALRIHWYCVSSVATTGFCGALLLVGLSSALHEPLLLNGGVSSEMDASLLLFLREGMALQRHRRCGERLHQYLSCRIFLSGKEYSLESLGGAFASPP